MPVKEGQQTR